MVSCGKFNTQCQKGYICKTITTRFESNIQNGLVYGNENQASNVGPERYVNYPHEKSVIKFVAGANIAY